LDKRKNRTGAKQLFAILMIFCLTLLVAHTLYAQEHKLGDIPLHPDVYKKHLKAYPTDFAAQAMDALPTFYDARGEGIVTSAKNQGGCGSCWAFASVGAMESHILKKNGSALFDLSEQQQVSCNTSQSGCCGGSMSAIRFWENQGSIRETCFQYGEYNTSCPLQQTVNCNLSAACPQLSYRVINWGTLAESQFKLSLSMDGPSYFRFDVYDDFNDFWSGNAGDVYVYQSGAFKGGHAVLLIGWDDSKGAYLCKNSWGESDGPNGDGTFWIAYSGHAIDLNFGMANFNLTGGCGDGVCDLGEDSCNCPGDCGAPPLTEEICDNNTDDDCDGFTDCDDDDCHGTVECICDSDGVCEVGENCTNCPEDCISSGTDPGCGNGVCEPGVGEDCISCPSDCAGKQVGTAKRQFCCGDGDGTNAVGCEDERCNTNEYACNTLQPDFYCCGDGTCEGAEDSGNCLIDCPEPICSDGVCDPGEDSCNCSDDCGNAPSTETNCSDGLDNDCDGLIDSNDNDCINNCLGRKEACTEDSECCSNWCHRGACK